MSKMQGIQIMTGRPTHRADEHSLDGYQYLTLLDIEARFIERYPDEFSAIERLLKESCLSKPCIIESKSGGQHFYFEAAIKNRQNAAEKAEKMLQSGASEREAAKEANITRHQARRISGTLSDGGCAANRYTIASQPHPTISESIINLLAKGQLTTAEIVDRVNGSRTAIMDEIKGLIDTGDIVRVKRGVYALRTT